MWIKNTDKQHSPHWNVTLRFSLIHSVARGPITYGLFAVMCQKNIKMDVYNINSGMCTQHFQRMIWKMFPTLSMHNTMYPDDLYRLTWSLMDPKSNTAWLCVHLILHRVISHTRGKQLFSMLGIFSLNINFVGVRTVLWTFWPCITVPEWSWTHYFLLLHSWARVLKHYRKINQ